MSSHVTTHNPARADVADASYAAAPTRPAHSRGWALAGVGAGLCGVATIVTSSLITPIYDPALVGDPAGIKAALAEQTGQMWAFHTATTFGAVLLVVFAVGLARRLRTEGSDSIAPMVALSGLVGTAVVSIMGSGLDTEFIMGIPDGDLVQDANAALFNHWTGTIPWLWTLAGLAGLAVWSVQRRGDVPRWIGLVGLVLGGLTVVAGVSPAQYMAGMTGALWLLVTALGFALGDREHRA